MLIYMSVSLVITSCNRPYVLQPTLQSFFHFNTYPIKEVIIIDDSGIKGCIDECCQSIDNSIKTKIIYNEFNIGQIKSIDIAYSHVTSEYIFHCEDDWLFYKSGFIEQSLKILENNDIIICVWLRAYNNFVVTQNGHNVLPKIINNSYRLMNPRFKERTNIWMGFTFNPGLRRLSDYKQISPYSQYMNDEKYGGIVELNLSSKYNNMNKFAAITLNEEGFVRHIGWDCPIR